MNSQHSRPGSSGSSSAGSHTPAPAPDMREKAGEAASTITDAARQASGEAKQGVSSFASDATKRAKGLLNVQVTAGADMVDHVAGSAPPAPRRESRSKRAAARRPHAQRSGPRRGILAGSARADPRGPHPDGVRFYSQAARAGVRPRLARRFPRLPCDQEQSAGKLDGAGPDEGPLPRQGGTIPWPAARQAKYLVIAFLR